MPAPIEVQRGPERPDPYRNFRFRLVWNGTSVAGMSKASALAGTTPVVNFRADGDHATLRHLPRSSHHDPITLERGVTHDMAFTAWANATCQHHKATTGGGDPAKLPYDARRDLVLEIYNEDGQKMLAYRIFGCWPSEFIALPDLGADDDAVAIALLVLQYEGWERDTTIIAPGKPSSTLPEA